MTAETVTFWQGIAKLPEPAQHSFWDAGLNLSAHIGEPANPRRLEIDTSRPPAGMPWWEKLLFYVGQGQYNQAVANMQSAEATAEGAKWLWGALQGDFNKNPSTGQVIVGGIISMIPLVDQACDVRDIIANCLVLSDEEARKDNENWIALGLTCIGFVPEFGSAVKTVGKVAIKKATVLIDLLHHMEWFEKNYKRLKVGLPWGFAPIAWLRKFDWIGAANKAADFAKRAFLNAQAKAEAAVKYAFGAIKAKLEQLAALFKQIAAKISETLNEVARRIKQRVDEMLGRARRDAGNYDATPGTGANRHLQDEAPPPRERTHPHAPGRCTLRPYRPDTCAPNTGHHVVPDRVFRIGKRGSGARIPGGPSEAQGLVICVEGRDLSTSREHGRIHNIYDPGERVLGAAGTPPGTAALVELEALGAMSVAQVTGCNPLAIEAQLRTYHQALGLGPTAKVRADPDGRISKTLNPQSLGTGQSAERPNL